MSKTISSEFNRALDIIESKDKRIETLESKLAKAKDILKISEDRSLDWDMMSRVSSLKLLQSWREKCFEFLKELESEGDK